MRPDDADAALRTAARHALAHLAQLDASPVAHRIDPAVLRQALGGPLPDHGADPAAVVDRLADGASAGIVRSAGPRYFGFVTGGALPAAVAADWLTSAWDQNGALGVMSPAAAVVEEIVAGWVLELLGLPRDAGVGIVTGAQQANVACLAAARDAVLARSGWDTAARGLIGAPPLRLVVGQEAHVTVGVALRLLGLGAATAVVPADGRGRMRADALSAELARADGPTIVCAQAGNVNTGACDPLAEIADACSAAGAWLHVDGAFGLWAAAAPARAHLVAGAERADSWATDGHKWLNVPYDCGLAVVADATAQRTALRMTAPYLDTGGELRNGSDWAPESSRRIRAFPLWAAVRSLGRAGVAELVERTCALARRMADRLGAAPGVELLNEVELNQVLVRFHPAAGGSADDHTRAVVERVQREGTCWVGGTVWRGRHAMRISVSNWSTTEADADRSVTAILSAARAAR